MQREIEGELDPPLLAKEIGISHGCASDIPPRNPDASRFSPIDYSVLE